MRVGAVALCDNRHIAMTRRLFLRARFSALCQVYPRTKIRIQPINEAIWRMSYRWLLAAQIGDRSHLAIKTLQRYLRW